MAHKLTMLLLLCCTALFAEYQAFLVKGCARVPDEGRLKTVSFQGVLVTPACYPCGASFGTGYPSRLYVKTSDGRKAVQVQDALVRGGLYRRTPQWVLDSVYDPQHPTSAQLKYMKKSDKGWIQVEASLLFKGHEYSLVFTASGSSGVKYHDKETQLYLKFLSGSLQGSCEDPGMTMDPVNLQDPGLTVITGSCGFRFSRACTELIRGTADWGVIDNLILGRLSD